MAYATILAEESGGVLNLTLNRPQAKNAMSLEMVAELSTALADAEKAGNVRVIVLRGAGGTFCAGGDIADMARASAAPEDGPDLLADVSRAFGEMCSAFSRTGIAVVAVVEGAALGGGFGLACVADVTIAASDAKFGLPETSLGIVPAQIAPALVERLGYGQAKRLAVLGGFVGAEEALRIGLVHEIAEDLDAAIARTVERILRCAPSAVAETKALLAAARFSDPGGMVERAALSFSAAVRGEEGAEGTKAFLDKRPPRWAPPSPRSR